MNDFDELIRDTLLRRAAAIDTRVSDPVPTVQRRATRIRYRRTALVVAGLASVGLAGSAVAVAGNPSPDVATTPGRATTSGTSTAGPSETSTSATGAPVMVFPSTRQEALDWGLAQNAEVIRNVTLRSQTQGVLRCRLRTLKESPAGDELYGWIRCQDYFLTDGEVREGSSASLPIVAAVLGSGKESAVTRVWIPSQSKFAEDIRRLFPSELQDQVSRGNVEVGWDSAEQRRQAERELRHEVVRQIPAPPGP